MEKTDRVSPLTLRAEDTRKKGRALAIAALQKIKAQKTWGESPPLAPPKTCENVKIDRVPISLSILTRERQVMTKDAYKTGVEKLWLPFPFRIYAALQAAWRLPCGGRLQMPTTGRSCRGQTPEQQNSPPVAPVNPCLICEKNLDKISSAV